MSLQEDKAACDLAAAEARIGGVQALLLDPRQETIDRAMADLSDIASMLNMLVATGVGPAGLASIHRIREAARRLMPQIEQASTFCLGWIQLHLGTGYTQQGLPVFVEGEARSSFEG